MTVLTGVDVSGYRQIRILMWSDTGHCDMWATSSGVPLLVRMGAASVQDVVDVPGTELSLAIQWVDGPPSQSVRWAVYGRP